jgi:hypothetical protein
MGVCLLLVATGPLFYLAATPEDWWWIVGAWVVWIAYAGLNVCLPNLLLMPGRPLVSGLIMREHLQERSRPRWWESSTRSR